MATRSKEQVLGCILSFAYNSFIIQQFLTELKHIRYVIILAPNALKTPCMVCVYCRTQRLLCLCLLLITKTIGKIEKTLNIKGKTKRHVNNSFAHFISTDSRCSNGY